MTATQLIGVTLLGLMNWCDKIRNLAVSRNWERDADWIKTKSLRDDVQEFRRDHPGTGISFELFDRILDWKLRGQRPRTNRRRSSLTPDNVAKVVECAYSLRHSSGDALDDLRLRVLCSLPGVGSGVASAILALSFPERYGVIDVRVWEVMFNEDKTTFDSADYVKYLHELRRCASTLGFDPQFMDFLTWTYWDSPDRRDTTAIRRGP